MNQSDLLFVMRINKARHDKDFQFFLARSFGQIYRSLDPDTGYTCVASLWRGVTYILSISPPPQEPS
jgi:hypothetical protein